MTIFGIAWLIVKIILGFGVLYVAFMLLSWPFAIIADRHIRREEKRLSQLSRRVS